MEVIMYSNLLKKENIKMAVNYSIITAAVVSTSLIIFGLITFLCFA